MPKVKSFFMTLLFTITVLSGFLFFGCSVGTEIQSTYSNNPVNIDGNIDEWGTSLNYLKDDNIAFGFKNNKENIYISIVTADRAKIMKVLTSGLTVWLETGKDKIGIKYPIRPDREDIREMRMDANENNMPDMEKRIISMLAKETDLQVVTEDDLPLFTDLADKGPGFVGKISYKINQLVYELQVPLVNNKIAERVFGEETKDVKISFETGKMERGNFSGGSRPGGGEMRPRQGGREGGMRPPQGGRPNLEPLEYTFKIILSK